MSDRPTADLHDEHPDPETLAAYVDGQLEAGRRAEVEAHAAECRDCREILADTAAFVLEMERHAAPSPLAAPEPVVQPPPKVLPFRPRWRGGLLTLAAVAAAALIVVRVQPTWLPWGDGRINASVAQLVVVMNNQPARPFEGRLSGGFAHRPAASVTRGPSDRVTPAVQIAASEVALAASGATATQLAARGLASLTMGEIDQGITEFEGAVEGAPANPSFQNDLAAAYLARAARTGNADDLRLALQAADRALAVAPAMPEALFNRALALYHAGAKPEAQRAWQAYLAVDPDSEWAREARAKCSAC